MQQLTIALDEDVARWARHRAGEQEVPVARLVSEVLRSRMLQEEDLDGESFRMVTSGAEERRTATVQLRRQAVR